MLIARLVSKQSHDGINGARHEAFNVAAGNCVFPLEVVCDRFERESFSGDLKSIQMRFVEEFSTAKRRHQNKVK